MTAADNLLEALHRVIFTADLLYEHQIGSEQWRKNYDALEHALIRYSEAQETYDAHRYAEHEQRATRH